MTDAKLDPQSMSDEQLAQAIEAEVRDFLKEQGGVEGLELGKDQEIWGQFDSLLIMELLVHMEERFGVQLNTGKLNPDDLKTIGRITSVATQAIRAAKPK